MKRNLKWKNEKESEVAQDQNGLSLLLGRLLERKYSAMYTMKKEQKYI
jgi:hypothetical protein